jgi:hypothetical protein
MSGKSSAQGQLKGFTGDAGGNRLNKDALSGRDLVPFFLGAESVAQSEKQNGNSAKVKVSRTNGILIRHSSFLYNASRRLTPPCLSFAPHLSI